MGKLNNYNKKQFLLNLEFFETEWINISGNLKIYDDNDNLIINNYGKITKSIVDELIKKVNELEKNNIYISEVNNEPIITGNVIISGMKFHTDLIINGFDDKYVTLSYY